MTVWPHGVAGKKVEDAQQALIDAAERAVPGEPERLIEIIPKGAGNTVDHRPDLSPGLVDVGSHRTSRTEVWPVLRVRRRFEAADAIREDLAGVLDLDGTPGGGKPSAEVHDAAWIIGHQQPHSGGLHTL